MFLLLLYYKGNIAVIPSSHMIDFIKLSQMKGAGTIISSGHCMMNIVALCVGFSVAEVVMKHKHWYFQACCCWLLL
jgi:hypothetical protein